MDKVTQDRINLLHPAIREDVRKAVEEADNVLTGRAKVRIVQGLRTIEEQDALYAQGRTKPGKKVTNAKGGSSFHNYGLAVDFALLIDGKEISWDINKDYDNDKAADWKEVVAIFEKYGFFWGGKFSSIKDYPHFEKTFGYTWRQLFDKHQKKDFINDVHYVKI